MQKESEGEKSTLTISEMKSEKKTFMCVESRAAATISSQFKKKRSVKLNLEIQYTGLG